MSYKQNNPLSRKSSPLNGKGDKCPDSGCVQEAGDGKWKVISGQTGKDWPSTFPSRDSAEEAIQRYHAGGFSRQPSGGNKGDEKKSVRDYEGPSRKSSSQGYNDRLDESLAKDGKESSKKQSMEDRRAESKGMEKSKGKGAYSSDPEISRKSSSPLNQDERSGHTFLDKVKGTVQNVGSYLSDVPGKLRQRGFGFTDKDYNIDYHAASQQPEFAHENVRLFDESGKQTNSGTYHSKSDAEAARLARNAQERKDRVSEGGAFFRKSSSPLNNTGMTGLNYSKELRYMPIEDDMHRGMSRNSSSPLDYGSWAHEDATRAKDLYKKGDYAHARALGIDEHDADYGKWRSSEAEHGPSRSSSKLREKAMELSEGVEQGDYDYENPRVQRLLKRAGRKDARGGKKMKMTMTKNIRPAKKTMTKSIRPVQKKK